MVGLFPIQDMIWICPQFSAGWERSPANNPMSPLNSKEGLVPFQMKDFRLRLLATLSGVGAVMRQKSHFVRDASLTIVGYVYRV